MAPAAGSMSAEEAIIALKAKIERLGPVNMMAIEQFDDLEARHVFLTTQRTDLTNRSRRPPRPSSVSTKRHERGSLKPSPRFRRTSRSRSARCSAVAGPG
jgi:hypothetical protein